MINLLKNKKGLLSFLNAPLFALSQNNNNLSTDSSNKKDVIGSIKYCCIKILKEQIQIKYEKFIIHFYQ